MNWVCLAQHIPCCLRTVCHHCSQAHKLHGQGPDLTGAAPESLSVTEWVIPSNAGVQHCKSSFSAGASHVLHSEFYLSPLSFFDLELTWREGLLFIICWTPPISLPNLQTYTSVLCFPLSSRSIDQLPFKEPYMYALLVHKTHTQKPWTKLLN